MKKFSLIITLTIILAFMLSACIGGNPNNQTPPNGDARQLSSDEAALQIKEKVEFDWSVHQLELENENMLLNDKEYYQFKVLNADMPLEPFLIVGKSDGEILVYYQNGAIYEPQLDMVFGQGSIDWNGSFAKGNLGEENYAEVILMQADNNSFEFSISVGANPQPEMEFLMGRIDNQDRSNAVFDSGKGFVLTFIQKGNTLELKTQGENPYTSLDISGQYQRR